MTSASHRIKTSTDQLASLPQELTFDTLTGELLAQRTIPFRTHRVLHYVGTACRFPCDARTREELTETLSVHDQWRDNLIVESDRLLDLLDSGRVSGGAVAMFRRILLGLAGRNLWFGSISDVGTKREAYELVNADLITVTKQGRTLPTKVRIHPWYGWRGDLMAREPLLRQWVGVALGE
ncbi:hypothetical protein [Pseudomonas matsuisoli]|uniref:Uncharacterized protein n=1 Tax=Pseudomonas matsuisoli TaxID=1515666 RepID=A0A917PR05_9PSED|nr:hypothetical protein [Pseudomonas matsuisoli]GGJ88437.1 hypothetical protein GCM10009304_12690 [Pseudomonas matsuisoli]